MSLRLYSPRQRWQGAVSGAIAIVLLLAGCSSAPKAPPASDAAFKRPSGPASAAARPAPSLPAAGSGRGGYYKDDGPGDQIPPGLDQTPDAEPRVEPYSKSGNRPYVVFGKTYTPLTDNTPLVQRGVGSWYGKKFHGKKTSSGEPYDMYKMSAAHPTLPIPSYARVTNLSNGNQVIVRVNDRGPFHSSRIIDLSYTAALKLGYIGKGSGQLEVERLLPDEIERIAQNKRAQPEAVPAMARQTVTLPAPALDVAALPEPSDRAQHYPVLSLPQVHPVQLVAEPPAASPAASPISAPVPAAIAMPASAATPLTSAYYLQFGAYAQADNADVMRARLTQDWANKLPPIEVVQNGPHYRLFSGPFATREQAQDAAQKVQNAGSVKPMVVQR